MQLVQNVDMLQSSHVVKSSDRICLRRTSSEEGLVRQRSAKLLSLRLPSLSGIMMQGNTSPLGDMEQAPRPALHGPIVP